MYLLQMDIFFVTAITMVVGLGLLDDDTVHIIYRRLWLKKPIDELNFSILSSAFLLSSGFLLFTLSNFQPIRTFGWISALIFMIGVIAELSTMEWIMSIIDRKKSN
jgi:predicted RND superfamily exporter protein